VSSTPGRPASARRWILPLIWLVLTVALILLARPLPWSRALTEMRHLSPVWVAAAMIANAAILPLWALEWKLLVPGGVRVTCTRMFEVVTVTASVLNSVPLLAGEASAVALLITRANLSRGAALSVLAMDQILVAFAKLAVIAAALMLTPLPQWVRSGGLTLVLVLTASLALLVPLAHFWLPLRERLLAAPTRARRLAAAAAAWGRHFDVLRDASTLWRVAALAVIKKSTELAAIICVQVAFGLEPSVATGVLVLAALALSTLVPVAPANLGVYEATVFGIYRLAGIPTETAIGLALIQHLCFLVPSLGTGYLLLTMRQLRPEPLSAS